MREFFITEKDEGQTLLKYSLKVLESAPQSLVRKFLRNKNIELNSRRADGSEKLKNGDSVRFWLSDDTFLKFSERLEENKETVRGRISEKSVISGIDKNWIIYEDDDYLILNKPAGIMSQSDGSGKVSVNDLLQQYIPSGLAFRAAVCNRLDTNTSGLLICGKTIKGLQTMDEAIKDRRIGKYYRCICHGDFEGDMHLEAYLKKDAGNNKVTITDTPEKGAEKIITQVHTVESFHDAALLEIKLITGKSHQIRAHLAHIGHPIFGDMKYGLREKYLKRQMLHAYRIELPPDILGGKQFTAPLPGDMQELIKKLG